MNAAKLMTYDDALGQLLATRATFGGGLSNHGPMATEALDHMNVAHWIGPFVEDYAPRLESRERTLRQGDWRAYAAEHLPNVVSAAAVGAGHCLLRAAHAIRGIERAEAIGAVDPVRVSEVFAALSIWRSAGSDIPAPERLTGSVPIDEWAADLTALATFEPKQGLLTGTLQLAAEQPGFLPIVASLQRGLSVRDTLDQLALLALDGYLANSQGLSRFTLLHGVTVSSMAWHLVSHLDDDGQRRLEAAVAGFVAAATVGFDRRGRTEPPAVPDVVRDAANLAERAGATLEDHTIKFTDACLSLADRTGSDLPLRAAEQRIVETTRV